MLVVLIININWFSSLTVSKGKLCEISSSLAVIWCCHLFCMYANMFFSSSLLPMLLREIPICSNLKYKASCFFFFFKVFGGLSEASYVNHPLVIRCFHCSSELIIAYTGQQAPKSILWWQRSPFLHMTLKICQICQQNRLRSCRARPTTYTIPVCFRSSDML